MYFELKHQEEKKNKKYLINTITELAVTYLCFNHFVNSIVFFFWRNRKNTHQNNISVWLWSLNLLLPCVAYTFCLYLLFFVCSLWSFFFGLIGFLFITIDLKLYLHEIYDISFFIGCTLLFCVLCILHIFFLNVFIYFAHVCLWQCVFVFNLYRTHKMILIFKTSAKFMYSWQLIYVIHIFNTSQMHIRFWMYIYICAFIQMKNEISRIITTVIWWMAAQVFFWCWKLKCSRRSHVMENQIQIYLSSQLDEIYRQFIWCFFIISLFFFCSFASSFVI